MFPSPLATRSFTEIQVAEFFVKFLVHILAHVLLKYLVYVLLPVKQVQSAHYCQFNGPAWYPVEEKVNKGPCD